MLEVPAVSNSLDFCRVPDVWHVRLEHEAVLEPGVARIGDVVQQRHVLVAARLGVGDARQARQLEAHGVAALAAARRKEGGEK